MIFSFTLSPVAYGALRCIRNLTFTLALPFSVATAVNAESVTVFALGDSLTAGYGLADGEGLVPQLNLWLADQGADITVLNGGVSGDTSAGGLSRLAWSLTPEVDAMIVTLGGNDLLRGLQPVVTRNNIEKILVEAQTRALPVLLIGMEAPGNFGPDYKTAFDQLYPELAAQYGAQHIASYFGLIDPDATDPGQIAELMQADGIHPNADGVKRAVESLGPQILKLVGQVD
ncbi:arylesterase [Pseudotabrizicola sp.]|uniref:arylesterase n=1 Tax=Pseudotabrizicola sp. TaxID=2939647 RepID=UPI00271F473D|nr:arylesterase [Pseudotabrizicola sp.]MDO8882417.1 arylesterase [Pseudotabrizicola sp.]